MARIDLFQTAITISANESPAIYNYQSCVTISYNESPQLRALQTALTFSAGPGRARPHHPINIKSKGVMSLIKDMPAMRSK